MRVINESRIDYKFRLSPTSPIIAKTIFSNKAVTEIINEQLKLEKKSDKENACTFDIITYTVIISNISNNPINNLYFKDNLDEHIRFIENTLRINDKVIRCANPNFGIYLGDLQPNDIIKISFSVVVLPKKERVVKNFSQGIYDYVYNIEKPPIKMKVKSNDVYTEINNSLFKQINVSSTIDNDSNGSEDIDELVSGKAKIRIIKNEILTKYWDEELYTLIIMGFIEYEFIYNCYNGKSPGRIIWKDGFSTFMKLPSGVRYCDDIIVKPIIENSFSYIKKKRAIYVDTEILLII